LITSKKGWNLKFPPFSLVEAAKSRTFAATKQKMPLDVERTNVCQPSGTAQKD
jgi:hypothetical protein